MKKILIYLLYCTLCNYANAQSISVRSFKLLESDLTANTAGTAERDQNGEVAALIKVVTTQTGFTFDCGSMGIVKTVQKPAEIWVYVPHGVKKMTISHHQLGLLRDYYLNIPIEKARTYEMVLVSGTVQTIVNQSSNSQHLVLKVTPTNAVVELNNEILPTTEGIAQKFVKLGSYEYRVQAPNYHTSAGIVTVNDPNNKKIEVINLAPAFGWIEIPANPEYNGAQVYIDNALAGTIPMKSQELPSGEHSIKIVKVLYNPYSQKVLVKDNETTQVTPTLSANFSEVTISVDNDADIYINGELKAKSAWTGKLEAGSYLMEAKKDGHRPTSQNIDIISSSSKQDIKLLSPTPIYGKMKITSTPSMSTVIIDGKVMGETPLFLTNILCVKHQIQITHKGYREYYNTIEVVQNKNNVLDITLDSSNSLKNNEVELLFKSEINYPLNLYIDKTYVGSFRFADNKKFTLSKGKHTLEGVYYIPGDDNPTVITEKVTLFSSGKEITFKQKQLYTK